MQRSAISSACVLCFLVDFVWLTPHWHQLALGGVVQAHLWDTFASAALGGLRNKVLDRDEADMAVLNAILLG